VTIHAEPVLRGVGIGEPAHHRHVHDFRPDPLLAEIDHVGIGAGGGQQRHRRRDDRQSDQRALGLGAGQQLAERRGRLLAALAHVEMRVGAVADERIDRLHHAVGDVGVEVERRDDRHVRPDDLAHHREEGAFRVVVLGRHRRTVGADIDRVERQRRAQPGADRAEKFDKERVLDRPVRFGHRQRDADRDPRTDPIHCRDEARRFGQHRRRRPARLADDVVTLEIGPVEKMLPGGDRREFVALDREAHQGDARRRGGGHGGRLRYLAAAILAHVEVSGAGSAGERAEPVPRQPRNRSARPITSGASGGR
jgi:hypothetical protein